MSAAAGVLATAAVTPAIAVSSVAAADTIGIFEELPAYLEIGDLAQRTNIYANNPDGSPFLLAQFYDQNRVEVPWEKVSGYAKDALVAGEDPRYYEHGGIDLQGTVRAVVNNAMGKSVQGGSSITQQYVKNVNIQNYIKDATTQEQIDAAFKKATEVSEARKLREMRYAIELEKKYSKEEILLGYLNIVAFGGRVYGIEAASNYYFGTTAEALTLAQAASLMAIVNNPEKFRLDYPDSESNGAANGYAGNRLRRDYILGKMLDEKMITQQEYDDAIAAPVEPHITQPATNCEAAGGAGFFCDYITNIFKNNEFFGPDPDTRWHDFRTAGYDIYTSLEVDLQRTAEQAIADNVPFSDPNIDIGSVAVTVEPGTGRILAMAQNKRYSADPEVLASDPTTSAVNFNTDRDYGGSSGFQPGSTYKMFTLLEWLKEGHGLNEAVNAQRRPGGWGTFKDSCEGGTITADPTWNPKNDEGESGGSWTALYNTVRSMNTGFIAMAKQLDLCEIRNTAQSLGVHRADGRELEKYPTTVLGTNEIAPLTMAAAYAAVAAGGKFCEPIAIDRIVDPSGNDVPVPPQTCNQAIDPNVAAGATFAMQQAFKGGTGAPSAGKVRTSVPIFSKTGTTDEAEATWMTGGSTRATTVVGVFNASGHVNLRKSRYGTQQIATLRHNIWPRIMQLAADKWGGDRFGDPKGQVLSGRTFDIPGVAGMSLDQAKAALEDAGFAFADGGQQDSDKPVGTVIGTNPAGEASAGATVTVYTSNGALRTVPDAVGGAKNFGDARAALGAAGFGNVAESCVVDAAQNGKPVGQDPPAGSAARPDTTITITVAKDKC